MRGPDARLGVWWNTIQWLIAIAHACRSETQTEQTHYEFTTAYHAIGLDIITTPSSPSLNCAAIVRYDDDVVDDKGYVIRRDFQYITFSDNPTLLQRGPLLDPLIGLLEEEMLLEGNEGESIDPLWNAGFTVQSAVADLLRSVTFVAKLPTRKGKYGPPTKAQRAANALKLKQAKIWNDFELPKIISLLRDPRYDKHIEMAPGFSKRLAKRLNEYEWVFSVGTRPFSAFVLTEGEMRELRLLRDYHEHKSKPGVDTRAELIEQLALVHADLSPAERTADVASIASKWETATPEEICWHKAREKARDWAKAVVTGKTTSLRKTTKEARNLSVIRATISLK